MDRTALHRLRLIGSELDPGAKFVFPARQCSQTAFAGIPVSLRSID
jgi:hypothetical protein